MRLHSSIHICSQLRRRLKDLSFNSPSSNENLRNMLNWSQPKKQVHLPNRQSQKHLPETISETYWSNQWQSCCNVASPPSSNANPRNRFIFQWQFQKCVDLEQIFCNATSPISFDGNLRNMFILQMPDTWYSRKISTDLHQNYVSCLKVPCQPWRF